MTKKNTRKKKHAEELDESMLTRLVVTTELRWGADRVIVGHEGPSRMDDAPRARAVVRLG